MSEGIFKGDKVVPKIHEKLPPDSKILLVDDSDIQLKALRKLFKQLDYTNIATAESGKEALSLIKENNFSLIICDWSMPEMTGIELLEKLREDTFKKDIPLIMLTANSDKKSVVEAISKGVTDYIVKPVSLAVLEEKLENTFVK